ncbi:MAG: hypothetical protein WDO73_20230 [Ignavibacteriota bacterium]
MSLAHLTLPTLAVEPTARFLEQTLRYRRDPTPANSPVETVWLAMGNGQHIHIFYVQGFQVSPFEGEFGRHIAVLYPAREIAALKARLVDRGRSLDRALAPHGPRALLLPRAGKRLRLRSDRAVVTVACSDSLLSNSRRTDRRLAVAPAALLAPSIRALRGARRVTPPSSIRIPIQVPHI